MDLGCVSWSKSICVTEEIVSRFQLMVGPFMPLLTNWPTLNCVLYQKRALESIQTTLQHALPEAVTVQETPSSAPRYTPSEQQPLATYWTLLEMEAFTSPKPPTPHTRLTAMPWVMGLEPQRLRMTTEASLLTWKQCLQIEPNLDPLVYSTSNKKWLHLSSFPHQVQ